MFISLIWKKTILEMAFKSFIISKLDHQMLKSWKRIARHVFETISKFDRLKNWAPDCSAQDMFQKKLFTEILPWAEQSCTQFFRRSNLLVVSSSCAAIHFQLFDIWWSSLDKVNDFKAVCRIAFFRFGEINSIMILSFIKKIFFQLFFSSLWNFKL